MEFLNQLREVKLFLGSSNLSADITLVVQVLFYLVLCAGVVAQLLGKNKWHNRLQIPVVILNILFIVLMVLTIFKSVAGEFPGGRGAVPPVVTIIHATLGALAQLLAIYCLLAGLRFFPRKIGVLRRWMWATFTVWTLSVAFGIGVYILFYVVNPLPSEAAAIEPDVNRVEDVVKVPPADTTEPATEPTGEPAEAAVHPIEVTTEVVEPTPEQVEVTAEPAEIIPEQVEVTAEPVEVTTGPVEVTAKPVEVTAEPVEAEPTSEPTQENTSSDTNDDAINQGEPISGQESAQVKWRQLQPANTGPGARYRHAMQYHAETKQLFVFGGQSGHQVFGDVWMLDMSNLNTLTWRRLAAASPVAPPARYSTVMIVDQLGQNLYIAAGLTPSGKKFNDIWKLNLATETWEELTETAGQSPESRSGGFGGNVGGNLVLTHGFGATHYNDTWRFNVETGQWENITPDEPRPPGRHLFAATPSNGNLVLHGGCSTPGGICFRDDTWVLDANAYTWREVTSNIKPAGRQHHTLVADADSNQVVLFGGQGAGQSALNDLWFLDLATDNWQPVEVAGGPEARYNHAAVWVSGHGMLLYGGRSSGILSDMWLLSTQTPAPAEPTAEATVEPTVEPEPEPTIEATVEPTIEPTSEPTTEPEPESTAEPGSQ